MITLSLALRAKELPLRLLRKLAKFPKQFVNPKAVHGTVAAKREAMKIAQDRFVEQAVTGAQFATSKLTPQQFFRLAGFDLERSGELHKYFVSLADLVAADEAELQRVHGITGAEIQKILAYASKLKCNVWPHSRLRYAASAATGRDEPEWSAKEDATLAAAVAALGGSFGDVWLYLSGDLPRRSPDECMRRYFYLHVQPTRGDAAAELRLDACMKPLYMNRDFRILPPRVVVVPTAVASVPSKTGSGLAGLNHAVWRQFL